MRIQRKRRCAHAHTIQMVPAIPDDHEQILKILYTHKVSSASYNKARNVLGSKTMIAEVDGIWVGFAQYISLPNALFTNILNIFVFQPVRRGGIGRALCNSLKNEALMNDTETLVAFVPETNVPAQLFFANQGMKCVDIVRSPSRCWNQDVYKMEWRLIDALA